MIKVVGKDAELAKTIKKGTKVFIPGSLDYREVFEAEIGKKHKDFFVAANHIGLETEKRKADYEINVN